jgi:transcriptional regulator with XRE-family HTH domain
MVGVLRYSGDAERAARLQAARTYAGYATARAAAQHFGWPEARYISHEGAKRSFADALHQYAEAFSVSKNWLSNGVVGPSRFRDEKIRVDPNRVQQLKLRVEEQNRVVNPEDVERGRRLRLARRLAGFHSAGDAAAAAGVHRTTVSGAERGLRSFDKSAARTYAAAFGCEPRWLLEGKGPSGYSPEIEKRLESFLQHHDASESDSISHLPSHRSPPPRASGLAGPASRRSAPPPSPGTPVPEHELQGLARLMKSNGRARTATIPGWSMPLPFLEGALSADADGCVIVAVPEKVHPRDFPFVAGDRLILDTTVRAIFSEIYAVVDRDLLVIADARTSEGNRLAHAALARVNELVLIGRVVGMIAALRLR